jgi:hypothetical protein
MEGGRESGPVPASRLVIYDRKKSSIIISAEIRCVRARSGRAPSDLRRPSEPNEPTGVHSPHPRVHQPGHD